MLAYIVRRIALVIPMMLIVATLLFVLMRVVAIGDPATAMLGMEATKEAVDTLIHRMGLDRPMIVQYGEYLRGLAQLDLGRSLMGGASISESLAHVFPYTLTLTIASVICSLLLGVPLGVYTALRRNRLTDHVLRLGAMLVRCLPTFYLGLLILIALAVKLKWFPTIGGGHWESPGTIFNHLVLPTLTLTLPAAASFMRLTRSTFLDVLNADYVRTARAKGLRERIVLYKHALRNCVSATITVVGFQLIALIGNGVLIENVFGRPGMGRLIVGAVLQSDYTSIQSLLLVYAGIVVVINLLIDLSYAAIDPRIRYS